MLRRQRQSLTRRDLLRLSAAGVAGASLSGWLEVLAGHAAAGEPAPRKSCILLWMDGGPSHVDTFDPKPDASDTIRGDLQTIDTAVSGIRIGEKFPRLAALMQHAAILRGMSTEEADHGRARIYMHTGYKPGQGGVTYPGLGSTVSAELERPDFPLPNFVVTGSPMVKSDFVSDPGYRGPRHQPLALRDLSKGLENVKPSVADDDFNDRVDVLNRLEQGFARTYPTGPADAHRTTLGRALELMRSEKARAFDLSQEPASAQAAYGSGVFGRGCLLARRLVEVGVPFVEVYLSNWDSHERAVAQGTRDLMTQVDNGMAALIGDLKDRGLLDQTLIVWMGEFGRTPRINNNGGRDHYSRAWSTLLAGGGIRGGQVIGRTDAQAASVVDRPISVRDFLATICQVLGVDYTRKIATADGRPIRIVEQGETLIRELLA